METDVLVRGIDTRSLSEGDVLAFGDAGAYDTSLRSLFATGTVLSHETPSPTLLLPRHASDDR